MEEDTQRGDSHEVIIIALLKHGNPPNHATSYCPVSRLSTTWKRGSHWLISPLSLISSCQRNRPVSEQKGNFCNPALTITSHTEAGFQLNLKSKPELTDLSATYNSMEIWPVDQGSSNTVAVYNSWPQCWTTIHTTSFWMGQSVKHTSLTMVYLKDPCWLLYYSTSTLVTYPAQFHTISLMSMTLLLWYKAKTSPALVTSFQHLKIMVKYF